MIGREAFTRAEKHIRAALKGERVEYEFDLFAPHLNEQRRVHAIYSPHVGAGGEIKGIFILGLDVTERAEAEQAFERHLSGFRGIAFSWSVQIRTVLVGLVVGTVLNAINQGDVMMGGEPLDVAKVLLTYIVPYCVTMYGGWAARPR